MIVVGLPDTGEPFSTRGCLPQEVDVPASNENTIPGASAGQPLSDDIMLSKVVDSLCAADNGLARRWDIPQDRRLLPSQDAMVEAMQALRSVLFPGYHGTSDITDDSVRFHVGATLDRVRRIMREQIRRGLCFACEEANPMRCGQCEDRTASAVSIFLSKLPEVRRLLATDVQAAYEGDPAARSPDETIICYPGLFAITHHRLAHELHRLAVPILPRIISEHAHSVTGIDIHPGASIGEEFFIDHGTGVVIGETCEIGNRVRIYQGVTLGAKSFPLDENGNPIKGIPRHPIVEDDVVIYGGATILGRITIGKGTVVGGNVWLTQSTPAGSKVTQAEFRQDTFAEGGGI
jgi:serine O-acetyltransferase